MARNRDPFTQALSSLRERLHNGDLIGGAPVIVRDEADRLGLSTTPVREALARLSGEGLVERAQSGGYIALALDATAARDRYVLQSHLVQIAATANRRALGEIRRPAPRYEASDPGASVNALFDAIVRSAGNTVLWETFQRVTSHLSRLRSLELLLFDDLGQEAEQLFAVYSDDPDQQFEAATVAYHDRRIAASATLVSLVQPPGASRRT